MKVTLTPSWELSTEHAASSYGQPVLVNRETGEAFGPADPVRPDPSCALMSGRLAVARMRASTGDFTDEQWACIDKFVYLRPEQRRQK